MLTMTDLFCGAGGSSEGAVNVPGVEVKVASNHWNLAVQTHNTNHQNAEHICADLSQIRPTLFPKTDILWASPECTNHSQAKGKKRITEDDINWGTVLPDEAADRSRATMWDVVRFTEQHRYKAIIVENVVEAAKWLLFQAWLSAMKALGYRWTIVNLNSMHAQTEGMPAPQSRDRMYVVFTRIGDPEPDLSYVTRPSAMCGPCGKYVVSVQSWKNNANVVGRYRQQYVYRCPDCAAAVEPAWLPASSIIDWTNLGTRIGDREKPLATKTRARIAAGIARYWGPFHLEAAGSTYDSTDPKHVSHGDPNAYVRAWPTSDPLKTIHTTASKALAVPVEGREGKVAREASEALRTQTARNETGLAFQVHLKGSSPAQLRAASSAITDPLHTVAASGNHHGLVTSYYGTAAGAKPTDEVLDTVTTTDRHGLITPAGGTWSDKATPTSEPTKTMTTRESYGLVMRNNQGGAEMTTPVTEPLRTITTAGHQSLLTASDIEMAELMVDDVMFRMLEPDECKRAMAFGSGYVLLGTKREQVRLAGNAVTPPAARDIIAAVARGLGVI